MGNRKKKVIILFIILFATLSFIIITRPKNCETNDLCFNNAASRCSLAKVTTVSNDNKYQYEIIGKKGDNCIIESKLLNLSDSQPKDLRDALNGRIMKCSLPIELIRNKPVKEIENLNDYCTGELKEAILQITIEKLYEIIIKNLGQVSSEVIEIANITK